MARARKNTSQAAPEGTETDFELDALEDDGMRQALEMAHASGDYQVLADERFGEWSWGVFRVKSLAERNREPGSPPRVWVEKIVGPLDVDAVRGRWGGGVYEFRGYYAGHLRARITQELAGTREPVAAAPAAPKPSALEQQVGELTRVVGELAARVNAPPAPAAAPAGVSTREALELAVQIAAMREPRSAADPAAMMDLLREGMAMGRDIERARTGEPETPAWMQVLDRVMPALQNVLAGAVRGPRVTPPGPRTASSATVVGEPPAAGTPPATPAAPAAPEAPVEQHRMQTAVESFARSLADGDEPDDVAATLESILSTDELATVTAAPTPLLLQRMRDYGGTTFPVLMDASAETYLAAVQQALRTPPA